MPPDLVDSLLDSLRTEPLASSSLNPFFNPLVGKSRAYPDMSSMNPRCFSVSGVVSGHWILLKCTAMPECLVDLLPLERGVARYSNDNSNGGLYSSLNQSHPLAFVFSESVSFAVSVSVSTWGNPGCPSSPMLNLPRTSRFPISSIEDFCGGEGLASLPFL